jgi:hemolysin activation/secretion protein
LKHVKAWCVAVAAGAAWGTPALAQPVTSPAPASAVAPVGAHAVSRIDIVYWVPNPAHPKAEELLQAEIEVVREAGLLSPPGEGAEEGIETVRLRLDDLSSVAEDRFTDGAMTLFAPAVVVELKKRGLVGVYVTPDPAQFRVEGGRVIDQRPAGDTSLRLLITTGIVTEVRTVGLGDRVPEDETINNPLHGRIRERSPVQPTREGESQARNLLQSRPLDEYAARLSRHPGRRVDVAVSASGEEPGAVTLDYLVTENKPWMLFAQLSNTGTESTDKWREHFGFIHNQLTNADDILTLGYQTANFEDVHTVYGSYERPLLGIDTLRLRVDGSYYEYVASELGLPDADFKGDGWNAGGEVNWNFFQSGNLFLDAFAGAQFKHVRVDNQLAATEGEDDFVVPAIGVRLERAREQDRTDAEVAVEFNLPDVAGTGDDLDALGRTGADNDWTVLKGAVRHSFFLDPWFHSDDADAGGLANEILLLGAAQYAFENRLIPNEEMPLGGLYTVRGYPEAIVAGDSAFLVTAEYRYHIVRGIGPDPEPAQLFGRAFRFKPQYAYGPADWDVILKAFVDAGRVINSDRESFEVDSTLIGAGIGVELAITRHVNARLDWGFALEDVEDGAGGFLAESGDNELHFILTVIY